MPYWTALFVLLALAAGVAGVSGAAAVPAGVAWVLFLTGSILAVISLLLAQGGMQGRLHSDASERSLRRRQ
ncbi:MAG: hypothetical protein P4L83_22200 [Nevskia sp.]|nr:hypothetical protein [Nevskia sp.]